ncbi:MAG TPA: sulfotransferase domain-containing protein [Acidimicrobiia bacterium]
MASVTLAGVLDHLRSSWELRDRSNVHLFHYSDSRRDLLAEMSMLARALRHGCDTGADRRLRWTRTLESMRARSSHVTTEAATGFWIDSTAFLRSGVTVEWRQLMSGADIDRYWNRVSQLAAPDLARWAHEGHVALT